VTIRMAWTETMTAYRASLFLAHLETAPAEFPNQWSAPACPSNDPLSKPN